MESYEIKLAEAEERVARWIKIARTWEETANGWRELYHSVALRLVDAQRGGEVSKDQIPLPLQMTPRSAVPE